MRFTHIDVNFDVRYEGHQNCPKILSMNIVRVFSNHHLWHQNWHQYLWTSLCQFNFFVNLLHSLGVWFFDIWHLFDNLTSFWQLDIFLTFWHITWTISAHHWLGVKVGSNSSHDLVCPIPLYPHCPCGPYVLYPCTLLPHMPLLAIPPVLYCPMWPTPSVPIAHMSCTPYPCTLLPHIPLLPIPPVPYCPMWPTPPIAHVAHMSCTPYPCTLLPHMPYCPYPCTLYLLHPIAPCAPIAHVAETNVPHTPFMLLPHYPCPPLGNGPHR